ncbi:MAG: Uma2 family endonuclease [Oscillochloridaceae bacterium umkhey_bin13]
MTTETTQPALRIVRSTDHLDLDLEALQGLWSEQQYLVLSEQTRQLIEFTDGVIEVLPMPTEKHQAISRWLFLALFTFLQQLGGTVFYAPLRLQIRSGKFREPDLLVMCAAADPRRQDAYWLGADLVVEIVSPDRPARDTEEKPYDYAEAGIPEYWIVNPLNETITVLVLEAAQYREFGVFRRGEQACSHLLDGFCVPVDPVFDAR